MTTYDFNEGRSAPPPQERPVDPSHRLRRARDGRLLGGVAAGAADCLDLDVTLVRIAIVVLALFGGLGLPLYIAAWLLIPEEGADSCVLADLIHPASPA